MSNYTTGEMAKLCGVSVRTVQFYDTKGILHPSDLTEGGRRIYSDGDLTQMRLVCALKAIGLSLDSIKGVLESELSGKILSIMLDEQEKILSSEIVERQKQLEMINVIKENISNKAIVPANSILDVEHIMEKKNRNRSIKKLALTYTFVAITSTLGLAFIAWLVLSQIWWGLGLYFGCAIFGIVVSLLALKNIEYICPNCDSVTKPPLGKAFFNTGNMKVRWMKCPECGEKNWCVMRKQKSN
jgi:DNA-binding transcriptional MerR regulator/predicted RNA-binding Zn-ribbon protein involved in translation (DUF1610 family)